MTDDPDVLGSYWTLAGDVDPSGDRGWSPWDFERRVETAAEVGFTGIGLWHDDLRKILEDRSLDEMRGILDEHDIEHVELEFVDDWFLPPEDDRRATAGATNCSRPPTSSTPATSRSATFPGGNARPRG